MPYSELVLKIKPYGKIGKYLYSTLENLMLRMKKYKLNLGETYILGDSPLVLLTALQSSFDPDPSSSDYVDKPCPIISSLGVYQLNPGGRKIRVYQHIDTGLMFGDFFAKLELLKK